MTNKSSSDIYKKPTEEKYKELGVETSNYNTAEEAKRLDAAQKRLEESTKDRKVPKTSIKSSGAIIDKPKDGKGII